MWLSPSLIRVLNKSANLIFHELVVDLCCGARRRAPSGEVEMEVRESNARLLHHHFSLIGWSPRKFLSISISPRTAHFCIMCKKQIGTSSPIDKHKIRILVNCVVIWQKYGSENCVQAFHETRWDISGWIFRFLSQMTRSKNSWHIYPWTRWKWDFLFWSICRWRNDEKLFF